MKEKRNTWSYSIELSLEDSTTTLTSWYDRITFLLLLSSLQQMQPSLSLPVARKYYWRNTLYLDKKNNVLNCVVYAMNYQTTCCDVSFIATQLAKMGQTLYDFKGFLILFFQLPLRDGRS